MTQPLPCHLPRTWCPAKLGFDDLLDVFRAAEKPPELWRIGIEAEKFGVQGPAAAPLRYQGDRGVGALLNALQTYAGWSPESEYEDGPVIALRRHGAAMTLEPGSQLELSGAPGFTVHEAAAGFAEHLEEIAEVSRELEITWLGTGFHPLATQRELDWVPKQRYSIMRDYLPSRGAGAWDMMRRTATVQANFDFSDEEDAMRKLRVLLRFTPVFQAMFANAPLFEGRVAAAKSVRQQVWQRMDPSRSGLIGRLWGRSLPSYADYVEWALDAGMFMFKRDGRVLANTGQTFRRFMTDGFEGHYPTLDDWRLHLASLFPEARLKTTLEVRCCDALPRDLTPAVPALFTGLLYDNRALAEAEQLALGLELPMAQSALEPASIHGLDAVLGGRWIRDWAQEVLDIASRGLSRRAMLDADGMDETRHLEPLAALIARGAAPADRLLERLALEPLSPPSIVSACAL